MREGAKSPERKREKGKGKNAFNATYVSACSPRAVQFDVLVLYLALIISELSVLGIDFNSGTSFRKLLLFSPTYIIHYENQNCIRRQFHIYNPISK
jgi:hypothetical protein